MMPAEFNVTGKVVFITGAERGIGKSIAQVFADVDIALNARTPRYAEDTAAQIATTSERRIFPVIADVTKVDGVKHAADLVSATFSRIDVLINPLGDSIRKPLVALPDGSVAASEDDAPAVSNYMTGQTISFDGGLSL